MSTDLVYISFNSFDEQLINQYINNFPEIVGIKVIEKPKRIYSKTNNAPDIIVVVLSITGNVAVGLLTNWLYDLLKKKISDIRINNKVVALKKHNIQESLESEASENK